MNKNEFRDRVDNILQCILTIPILSTVPLLLELEWMIFMRIVAGKPL